PILDLLSGLTPDNVEGLILEELADSALFALRFRQNAARALLLPRGQPGRRAPLWLQRLRRRDLLQVCRRHPDFPIVLHAPPPRLPHRRGARPGVPARPPRPAEPAPAAD